MKSAKLIKSILDFLPIVLDPSTSKKSKKSKIKRKIKSKVKGSVKKSLKKGAKKVAKKSSIAKQIKDLL